MIRGYADFRKLDVAFKCKDYGYAMLILLYLKHDHIVWNYRLDLTQFVDFEDIDLKKYTTFNYEDDSFTKKYIKSFIISTTIK